ncbi:MAG: dihydrofolate reductase family protein [Armatimonadota bacterium]|nr:dihydrofolate reductase family protein [Armatimonadota bacterium]MDR7535316.1 dihydrofolate reductase family protein [Armatimonadota bacterium]
MLHLVYDARRPHPLAVPLAEVYRELDVPSRPGRPAVIVNMVQTLDGGVAVEGRAWSIGSAVDHYLFHTLRGWADAVLSGAGTLRRNDVVAVTHPALQEARRAAGRPANPAAVVVTRRAEFDAAVYAKRFFTRGDVQPVVLTTELARDADRRRLEAAGAEVIVTPAGPDGQVDLATALGLLAARGWRRVLAEGGPVFNRGLFAAGLVDELFLTVTPQIAGVPDPRVLAGLLGGARARLVLISEYQYRAPEMREWYLRFHVAPP